MLTCDSAVKHWTKISKQTYFCGGFYVFHLIKVVMESKNPSEIGGGEIPVTGENPTEKDKGKASKNGGQNVRLKKAGDLENRR